MPKKASAKSRSSHCKGSHYCGGREPDEEKYLAGAGLKDKKDIYSPLHNGKNQTNTELEITDPAKYKKEHAPEKSKDRIIKANLALNLPKIPATVARSKKNRKNIVLDM